eukprot:3077296-Amphidinium_carterae.1
MFSAWSPERGGLRKRCGLRKAEYMPRVALLAHVSFSSSLLPWVRGAVVISLVSTSGLASDVKSAESFAEVEAACREAQKDVEPCSPSQQHTVPKEKDGNFSVSASIFARCTACYT